LSYRVYWVIEEWRFETQGCKFEAKIIFHGRWIVDGTNRANIKAGLQVLIVLKKDQHSGKLTEGRVKDILTKSPTHPHGIKVRLESGEVGRVKKIMCPSC
jgi:uncharacterized repeat protein (TIGR03833 family)